MIPLTRLPLYLSLLLASNSLLSSLPSSSSSSSSSSSISSSLFPSSSSSSSSSFFVSAASVPLDNAIRFYNHTLYVNNTGYFVQGIAYSPIPIGDSPGGTPQGDYFTLDYAYIWQRDLPLMRAMGANTIRIYNWNISVDHTDFLNAVDNNGMKVVITHYLGDTSVTDLSSESAIQDSIDQFVSNVKVYGDHPAILMWMFGNELNGSWQGFLGQLSTLYNCGWSNTCVQYLPTSANYATCDAAARCVYPKLFGWINDAAKAAKQFTSRPIMTGFADVDWIVSNTPQVDKIAQYGKYLDAIDAYGMQLYRGNSFGNYFQQYQAEANNKPLLVTEYGIDAYNDPCGWAENFNVQPCANRYGDGIGGASAIPYVSDGAIAPPAFVGCTNSGDQDCKLPGEQMQAATDLALSKELISNSVYNNGLVIGGFIMDWVDEYWKTEATQDQCTTPCSGNDIVACLADLKAKGAASIYAVNQAAGCTWKAHVSCGNYNSTQRDLCGYWLAAAPDNYVNEQWFGMNSPTSCFDEGKELPLTNTKTIATHNLDEIAMRPVVAAIAQLWGGVVPASAPTCSSLMPCHTCATSSTLEQLQGGACDQHCGLGVRQMELNYGNGKTFGAATSPPATIPDGAGSGGSGTTTFESKNGAGMVKPARVVAGVVLSVVVAAVALML